MSDWRAARDAVPPPPERPAPPPRREADEDERERRRFVRQGERFGLPAIVDEAYALFARYRATPPLLVCQCNVCMPLDVQRELLDAPLREAPAKLLREWQGSVALGTVDADGAFQRDPAEADEVRHFLPRLMDLLAQDRRVSTSGTETSLRCLQDTGWHRWPGVERRVVQRFLDAHWQTTLADDECGPDAADVLTMHVLIGADIERALALWDAAPDPAGALHLAEARHWLSDRDGTWRFSNGFLEDAHAPAARRIGEWLASPAASDRLERAFFALEGDDPDTEDMRATLSHGADRVWTGEI